jgi:hypothetical protein
MVSARYTDIYTADLEVAAIRAKLVLLMVEVAYAA